jgi:hypothetical protein
MSVIAGQTRPTLTLLSIQTGFCLALLTIVIPSAPVFDWRVRGDGGTDCFAIFNFHAIPAQTVGRLAYVWGWSLINAANAPAAFAKVPEPGRMGGVIPVAYNRLAMLTGYIAPDQRFIAER